MILFLLKSYEIVSHLVQKSVCQNSFTLMKL